MDPAEVRRREPRRRRTSSRTRPRAAPSTTAATTRGAGQGAGRAGYDELRAEQAAPAGARRRRSSSASGCPATWRSPRGRRRRRDRPARGARRRHGHGLHRQLRARPGAPHRVGHAGPGRARHPDGPGHRDPRRHRPDPARASAPTGRGRCSSAAGRAQGRDRGQGPGPPAGRRHARGQPRPTWCSTPSTGPWQVARRPGHRPDLGRGRRPCRAAAA